MLDERGARMLGKGLERHASTYAPGAVVFREGDAGDRMFVIAHGRVRIVKRIDEGEITIASLGPGDCFGEMALLERETRSATAIVAEESKLVAIDAQAFEHLVKQNGEIAWRIMKRLSHRLREANRHLLNFLAENSARRAVEVIRSAAGGAPDTYRSIAEGSSPSWLAPRAGLSLSDAEDVWNRLRNSGILIVVSGALCLAPDAEVEDYLAYLDLKQKYDPVTARELAEMTGLPEDEVHRVIRKVLISRLGSEPDDVKINDSYRRYLGLKKRFEYQDRV